MVGTNNWQGTLDIRDIIENVELLEEIEERDSDEDEELKTLTKLLKELCGFGGDHQWRGDWYPVTLIRDDYFEEYAKELADDIVAIDRNAGWPLNCIDWEQAAQELQGDYSTVDYDGVTYWYR